MDNGSLNQTDLAPIRVIIADDHPMVREGLRSMLAAPGIEIVGEASDGHAALDLVRNAAPDVALLDIRMPDLDGLAVLEAINAEKLPTRVIVITTYRSTAYLLRALSTGAAGFVLKDIPRSELLDTIRAVADGASRIDREFLASILADMGDPDDADAGGPIIQPLPQPLTQRELDVLRLMVEGLTNQAIAHALTLSPTTVKGYVQTVLQKLDAADRTQAAVKAIRLGLAR